MNGRRLHTLLGGLALGLALTVAPVFAQEPGSGVGGGAPGEPPRFEDNKDRILKGLQNRADLTDEQSKAVSAILDETAASTKETAAQMEALREKMKTAHQAAAEKIKAQLTDEQKKKVGDMPFIAGPRGPQDGGPQNRPGRPGEPGERPRQFAGPGGPGGPDGQGGPGQRFLPPPEEMLDRVADRLNLSDEQKEKAEAIFKEGQEKIKAAREDTKTKFRAILTDDQAKQLDEMEARRAEAVERLRDRAGANDEQRPAFNRRRGQDGDQAERSPKDQGREGRLSRNRAKADQNKPDQNKAE